MLGRVLAGRYRITEKIGSGGMAEVFKAQDETLGRVVAVKIMLPQFASDPTFAARFRQEAKAAANLSSPYIVNVYDWGQDDNTYFIVMEYVRGINLKTAILQRGAINAQKAAEIGSQVCSALAVAHSYDIIHRDIKPHNIMVQPDGNAKVMDFGIARAGNSELTQTSSVLGTAHYVSPEQAQGKKLTPASDLYSLGIVLYEATTGKLPFDAPDAVAVALKQVSEQPVPPHVLNPNIDPELEAIILCAMQKDPKDRFVSAIAMRNALNNYLAGRPVNIPARAAGLVGSVVAGVSGTASGINTATSAGMTAVGSAGAGGAAGMTGPVGRGTGRGGAYVDKTAVLDTSRRPTSKNANAVRRVGVSGNTGGYQRDQEMDRGPRWPVVAAVIGGLALVAIIAVVLILKGIGAGIEVPNVTGMSQQAAERVLTEEGFVLGEVTAQSDEQVTVGNVVSQKPDAHEKAVKGSRVSIVISSGPAEAPKVKVPDLSGKTPEEAQRILTEVGLSSGVSRSENDSSSIPGTIFRQSPVAGSMVAKGSSVSYTVSLGTKQVGVPKVTGLSQSAAQTQLQGLGFVVNISESYSSSVEAGLVMSQDPADGSTLPEGSAINLVVSKGPEPKKQITVPSLVGKSEAEAQATADANGFKLSINYEESESGSNLVVSQDPSGGSKIDEGGTVSVTIMKKVEPTTPDPPVNPEPGNDTPPDNPDPQENGTHE